MEYKEIESLETFLIEVETSLMDEANRLLVTYPQKSVFPWNSKELDANKDLLAAVSGSANVYAIFTSTKGLGHFSLRYIGKTTKKLARQRIRNHLIKKSEGTGAKLQHVIDSDDGSAVIITALWRRLREDLPRVH